MLGSMFRGMRSFWAGFARASRDGSVLELPGVSAAIMPAMPERSVVNCVVYNDAGQLRSSLDELAAAYDAAGVRAWPVWVHGADERAQAVLAAAGNVLDAEPMGQQRDLVGLEPPPLGDLQLFRDPSPAD